MDDLVKLNVFNINNRCSYDKENLSYMLFENKNLYFNEQGITFFRCDFRGSKFIDCNFYKNNLD